MDKLIKKHFSLADWDFEPGHLYFISSVYSISPPSSLAAPKIPYTGTFWYCYLKDSLAPCVPDGRFIAYFRSQYDPINLRIFFRQQPPLTHHGFDNGYRIDYDDVARRWTLRCFIDRVVTYSGYKTIPKYTPRTWIRLKFDFYQYLTLTLIRTLRVETFLEVDGQWESLGFLEDGNNAFADSPTNRIGFALQAPMPGELYYTDDTEIWARL